MALPTESRNELPLRIHGRYTRTEILAAFDQGKGASVPEWREGVKWIKNERADLLAFTLNKTAGHFSPTTRYRDYAISKDLMDCKERMGVSRKEMRKRLRISREVDMKALAGVVKICKRSWSNKGKAG